MKELKITALTISRISLVVFTVMFMIVLPQLNSQEYVSSTITSKLIYFFYSILILLFIYILTIIFSKVISITFSKIDLTLFIFLLYITINRYFIQSYWGFSIRYIELLGLSFFYILIRSISLKNYPWLLLSIIISGIIQAIYGILQCLGFYSSYSGFKITGSFFNPGPYAGFLVSVWTVALGMYLFKNNLTTQFQKNIKYIFEYISLLGIISIAIILPALQSRASWIAVLVGSGVLIELKYHYIRKIFAKVTLGFKQTAIVVLCVMILSTGLFSLYGYKKASADGRAFIWKVTTEIIIDSPVFGLGFDQFKAQYMNYQASYFAKNGETSEALVADNTYYAFNEWLQFTVENGLLGFLLLMIVIFILIKSKIKKTNTIEAFIAKTGLLTIGFFACFSYPMQILPIKMVIVFLLATLSNSYVSKFELKIEEYSKKQWPYKISLLMLTSVIIYQTFAYTFRLQKGFVIWNTALINYQYGDYKEAIKEFELEYSNFKKEGDFLMNYGKTLAMAGEYTKAIATLKQAQIYHNNTVIATSLGDSYKATKQFDKAEASYKQAINMTPSKFYAPYLLVKLYDDSTQREKAISLAQKIMDKKIKIPSTAIEQIRIEMKKILTKYKNPPGF